MRGTVNFTALIMDIRSGRPEEAVEAANQLADALTRFVWNCLGRFTGLPPADRQDLCQDVCVSLFSGGIAAFRGDSDTAFLAYVRTASRNAAYEYFKSSGRHTSVELDDSAQVSSMNDPATKISDRQDLAAVVQCASVLQAIDHEIFWMRVKGWPFERIAEVVALPLGTVASKEHRARQRIRACLEAAGLVDPNAPGQPARPRSEGER
jgi:RNA polymerase sigma factor (sigma-70 family)